MSSEATYRRVLEVNFHGCVRVTLACLPLLRAGGAAGRVVNVCSVVSHVAIPFSSAYCASKAALRSFSDGLRRELGFAASPISVHVIEPGFFSSTKMLEHSAMLSDTSRAWDSASAEVQAAYGGADGRRRVASTLGAIDLFASRDGAAVVNAMHHAVTSSLPREVYVCGADANTLWRLMAHLPAWLADTALAGLGWVYAGSASANTIPGGSSRLRRRGSHCLSLRAKQRLAHVVWWSLLVALGAVMMAVLQ